MGRKLPSNSTARDRTRSFEHFSFSYGNMTRTPMHGRSTSGLFAAASIQDASLLTPGSASDHVQGAGAHQYVVRPLGKYQVPACHVRRQQQRRGFREIACHMKGMKVVGWCRRFWAPLPQSAE
eukprot:scaffold97649_cov29-Tisochrysis_lutea.AAC.7